MNYIFPHLFELYPTVNPQLLQYIIAFVEYLKISKPRAQSR